MAVTKRYVVQIVIMTTEEQGAWIKERAQRYGVSEARIARDTIELGQDLLAAHYGKIGVRPLGLPERASSKRNARRKSIPEAQFTAPTAA